MRDVVNEALRVLDPTGETFVMFDEEVERWAIARLSPLPGDEPNILLHIAEDSGYRGSWVEALGDSDVLERIESGEWAGCPKCGQVHGKYKEPSLKDADTVMEEFPYYWPYGVTDYLYRQELVRAQLVAEAQRQKDERWGEYVEEAAWALKQSKDLLSNSASTKEERIEVAKRRERETARRLQETGQ